MCLRRTENMFMSDLLSTFFLWMRKFTGDFQIRCCWCSSQSKRQKTLSRPVHTIRTFRRHPNSFIMCLRHLESRKKNIHSLFFKVHRTKTNTSDIKHPILLSSQILKTKERAKKREICSWIEEGHLS